MKADPRPGIINCAAPGELDISCPACGGNRMDPLLTVEQAPISCAQLFSTREAAVAAGQCRVEIVLCASCGHLWNAAHQEGLASLYNEDYYSSFTASSQARQYQEALARDLDEYIGLDGKTVVEIGCGDGFFLRSLCNLGAAGIGFEPSSTFAVAAEQQDLEVFNENFHFDGTGGFDREVDVIVMRHVLEHMDSPAEVLASLNGQSFRGPAPKYLFLEVPNAVQLLEDNLYFDFYNDHVHYFCQNSLSRLLRSAGWTPLASMGSTDEFIRLLSVNSAYAPNGSKTLGTTGPSIDSGSVISAAKSFRECFGKWKEDLAAIITAQRDSGMTIAIWGAGARGIALLCGIGLAADSFAYVVDSDSRKHGKYLPVIHLPVDPVDQLRREPTGCVLVTSYTYFSEILGQLDWYRSLGNKVIRVYPTPELIS